MMPRLVHPTLAVAAALALVACGSSSKTAATTAAPTTAAATTAAATTAAAPTTAAAATTAAATGSTDAPDAPATTNAAPVPATANPDGSVTIKVTVGTDDFDTTGGKRVVQVKKGANVTIVLTDAATKQTYHLHGYDIEVDADQGKPGSISFTADQTGQFDLESHVTNKTLLVVVVA
jgi:glucose/arabinose dehydrogenase